MKLIKISITAVAVILLLPFLSAIAYADMGAKPTAAFSLTLDRYPFNNAIVSVQECQESKRYGSSDYSIAGLGTAGNISFDDAFLAVLEKDETGEYLTKEELESFYGYKSPWNDEQLQQARQFVLDEFDEGKQCYWHPSERSFTDCGDVECRVTYRVPASFRIKILDLETGKAYATENIKRTRLNTAFSLDFNSSDGRATMGESPGKGVINDMSAVVIFPAMLMINLITEMVAAIFIAYFIFKIKIKKIILPVLLGNLISHPIVYFVPQMLNIKSALLIVAGLEIFAVLFEAFLITRMANTRWAHAISISFVMNLISLFIGAFIPAL